MLLFTNGGNIAKLNKSTGFYEAEKYLAEYGKLLKAIGKTKEEANKNLKIIKAAFLANPLETANTKYHSPGYMVKKREDGKYERVYSKGRAFFTARRKGFNDDHSDS